MSRVVAAEECRLIPLLGQGGVRGGLINILADLQQSIRKIDRTTPYPSLAKEGNQTLYPRLLPRLTASAALEPLAIALSTNGPIK